MWYRTRASVSAPKSLFWHPAGLQGCLYPFVIRLISNALCDWTSHRNHAILCKAKNKICKKLQYKNNLFAYQKVEEVMPDSSVFCNLCCRGIQFDI